MTLQIQILVVYSANDIRWYLVKVLIIITCLSSIQIMFRKANDFFLHVVIHNRMIRVVFLFIYQLLKSHSYPMLYYNLLQKMGVCEQDMMINVPIIIF